LVKDGDKNLKSRFAYAFLGNLLQKLKKKSDRGVSPVEVNPKIPVSPAHDDASSNAPTPMGITNPFNNHPNFRQPMNMFTTAIAN